MRTFPEMQYRHSGTKGMMWFGYAPMLLGSSDRVVLARAQAENRVIVTFNKDFGELAFRVGIPAASGIVLFRIASSSSERIAKLVVVVLASRTDWAGHFTVVEPDRIRMKLLPDGS